MTPITCGARPCVATNRSKTASASSGPGAPSGWYWTVSIGLRPVAQALDRAVVEVDLADAEPDAAGSESPTTWTSWFWAVTCTEPESRSWTGWFAPWCPNRSRRVSAPAGAADDLVAEADARAAAARRR